jgi:hypothetical protein
MARSEDMSGGSASEHVNEEWKHTSEALLAERDVEIAELKDVYLRSLAETEQARRRIRAQAEEALRLVAQERDRVRAENAELQAELAQTASSYALPEKFWNILVHVVCHRQAIAGVVAALHPDRAANGDPRQRQLRQEMVKRFVQLVDYVRSVQKDRDSQAH